MENVINQSTSKIKGTLFSNTDLRNLIVPLVVEQILVMLVGMIDTIMVSFAGEAAISGVALVDMINNLFITVLSAVATGGAVIVSQYVGSKNTENASLSASQLVMSATLIGLVIAALCFIFRMPMLHLFYGSVEPDVMQACATYFLFTLCSFPFLGLYNAGAAIFRSMQKTNITMIISMIMNITNIIGNYIGVFILNMGVAGVAIPTLISRLIGSILLFVLTTRKGQPIQVRMNSVFSWHSDMIRRIFKIAVPNGI